LFCFVVCVLFSQVPQDISGANSDALSTDEDGYSAKDIFQGGHGCTGYTYDDVIVLPGHINFGVEEVL
jgi:hypothetical protein